jgi:ABC-type antimicrobial peptide transport system, ATPase component
MVIEGRELNLIYDLNKEVATYALRDVNINIKTGSFTGIIGPSGSGKSSLLYVLSGLKSPTSGTVYYDDIDIEAYTAVQKAAIRKQRFGFIFQKHFLINYMTVLDNVLSASLEASGSPVEKALEILEKLGIRHLAGKKPHQLSGGQRQRTAIARALINNPSIIFADEPTASLDHGNAREVMDLLESIKNDTAIVVVTHDRSILENADNIVEMWDGKIL